MAQKTKRRAKKPASAPVGRPDDYTEEKATILCARLSQGISLRTVCKGDDMPSAVTVFAWMRKYPEFLKQYEQAKQESADAMAEDCLDIADNQVEVPLIVEGVPMVVDGKMVMVKDSTGVAHAKLRVDTRKWLMAKMKPKKYGEKLELAGDPSSPVHSVTRIELCAPSCQPSK